MSESQQVREVAEAVDQTLAKSKGASRKNYVKDFFIGMAEKTESESALVPDSFLKPENPDDIWRKNSSFSLYEEMLQDEQVWVSSQLKKDLIVGSGFDIVAGDDGQEEIVKDLEVALGEDPEIPFGEMLEQMLPYDFGFSLTEKIFKRRDDGSITLSKLKTPHPDTWRIHTDTKGRITKYEQIAVDGGPIQINPKSLIHMVNQRRFQNPYGRSDLRAAYNPWFVKRHVIRFYSIFLEKSASPTPIGSFDARKSTQEDVDAAFDILKKLQTRTAAMIPDDIDMEYLESKSNGEAFIKGINLFNMFIGRALFIPDLIGFQGGETLGGSQALGKNQIDVFMKHLRKRRASLEKMVDHHIIKPLVRSNFGDVDNFPKFKLSPIDDDTAIEFAKTWIEAQKGKVYTPSEEEINHFRGLIQFPEGEVERPEPEKDPEDDPEDQPKQDPESEDVEVEGNEPEEKSEFKIEVGEVFDDTPGEFSKKVDFNAIATQLDSLDKRVMNEAEPIIQDVLESLKDQIEKKKILSNKKIDRIDDLKVINKKKLQRLLKAEFREHFKTAKQMARNELFKSEFQLPLESEEFLQLLEQETFQYVGTWEFNVSQSVRVILQEALKDGLPLSAVIDMIDERTGLEARTSLERFSRTKGTEVLNRGRIAFFQESGVVSGYQYSAILDNRTTPVCAGLHGKFFKAGSQPVPPLHFNCRSTVIPITKFESFTPTEKVGRTNIDTFISENIGKGFSKQ